MPIYEYICSKCGDLTEKRRTVDSRDKPTPCDCGGTQDRIPSRTSFHLKGGGWYKDSYGKGQ